MVFPLEFLLDLLRAGTIWTHESQQPLLQVGWRAKTVRAEKSSSLKPDPLISSVRGNSATHDPTWLHPRKWD